MSHTPGPWERGEQESNEVEVVGNDGTAIVCRVNMHRYVDEIRVGCGCETPRDNLALIAAAPDLLQALQELCVQVERSNAVDDHGHNLSDLLALTMGRAAIAKATGEDA